MRASDLERPFPFGRRGVEAGGETYMPWVNPNPFTLKKLGKNWHLVQQYEAKLIMSVDPATAMGNTSVEYVIPLNRAGVGTELDLLRPGLRDDVISGPNGIGGAFRWSGGLSQSAPEDYVFTSIAWLGTIDLFGCEPLNGLWLPPFGDPIPEYPLPSARYSATPDEVHWTPTLRIVLRALFDDGTEGTFIVQTPDPSDFIGESPDFFLPMTGTFDGEMFEAVAIGFNEGGSSTYSFGGVEPTLTITRKAHYEYRTQAGTHPLYDVETGGLLPGANPFDGRL